MRSLTKTLLCLLAALPSTYGVTLILGDTSGDARGVNALDIQVEHEFSNYVASGDNSIAIGTSNVSAGYRSIAFGNTNSAIGPDTISIGVNNYVETSPGSTAPSFAIGAFNSIYADTGNNPNAPYPQCSMSLGIESWITAPYSFALGRTNAVTGQNSFSAGFDNSITAADAFIFGSGISNSVAGSMMIGPSAVAKVTILPSGNVGIGTAAPTSKLHVVGDLNVTGTIINSGIATTGSGSTARLRVGGTTNPTASWQATTIVGADGQNKVVTGYLGSSTNGAVIGAHNSALSGWADLNVAGSNLIFRSSETERMRINSSGNVGVGTSAPLKKLHISGSGAGAQAILMEDTSQSANNKLWAMLLSGSIFQINPTNDSGVIGSSGFYMNRSGNVGLGSNPSSARFHILDMNGTGSIRIQNPVPGSQASIDLWDGSANTASFGYINPTPVPGSVGSLMIGTRNTTATVNIVAGSTTPTPRLTVLPGGNVGVGTTAPAAKLDVNGTAQFAGDIKVKSRAVIRVSPAGDIPMIANPSGTNPEL